MPHKQKEAEVQLHGDQPQPGQVVAPGVSEAPQPDPAPVAAEPTAPEQLAPTPPEPEAASEASPEPDEVASAGFFKADTTIEAASDQPISWTASEFIAHEKDGNWYVGLAAIAAVLTGVIFLITRDFLSCAVIVIGALLFGTYAARKPRDLEYVLDHSGFSVGPKHYAYEQFRCFSVISNGAFSSIDFMPLKRFAPILTIYYDPADEQKVIAMLNGRLPYQDRKQDAVERLMHRIRF